MSDFQSAEDFEKEHAALATQQEEADARRRAPPFQPKKKKRDAVSAEALQAEQQATDEIGLTNWIGKLIGIRLFPEHG